MPQMPVIRTPISMGDFARALLRTLRANGVTISKEGGAVFWAQYALETGAGGFCWNYNCFNHKVTQAQAAAGVPYMMLANTWEIINGHKETFQPPHPATWFRSFSSFESAMSHHIQAIRNGRYASSWPAVLAGDLREYATQLRSKGYYTASLESYAKLLEARAIEWMKSPAYDDALAELIEASMEETQPELPVLHEFEIVHRSPFDEDEEDEPPTAA